MIPYKSGVDHYGTPVFPNPIPLVGNERSTSARNIPYNGTLVDHIKMPTSNVDALEGYLDATAVWSVTASQAGTATDKWVGEAKASWLDTINGRLWILSLDDLASPWTLFLSYITLETGAVTILGSQTFSTITPPAIDSVGSGALNRASEDSGNFTLYLKDRVVVINETNGAFVSEVIGAGLSGVNDNGVTYVTKDGLIGLSFIAGAAGYVGIKKGGNTVNINTPLSAITAEPVIYMHNWGDDRVTFTNSSGLAGLNPSFYKRSDVDVWLKEMAIYAGI